MMLEVKNKKFLIMNLGIKWKIKVIIQFFLSKMPYGVKVNHQLQKLRGAFNKKNLLNSLIVQAQIIKDLDERKEVNNSTVLEIGPGWTLIGGILFYLKGASLIYGFDSSPHASFPLIKKLIRVISSNSDIISKNLKLQKWELNKKIERLLCADSKDELFNLINYKYCAPADAQRTNLKSESIDIIYSKGVLEHIPKKTLVNIINESKRILKQNGKCHHKIGLYDHYQNAGLDNGVNFLRFPDWYWNLLTGNSISYHNRLRNSDYIKIFKNAGLKVAYSKKELLQINLDKLKSLTINKKFYGYSKDDLAISFLDVDLIK